MNITDLPDDILRSIIETKPTDCENLYSMRVKVMYERSGRYSYQHIVFYRSGGKRVASAKDDLYELIAEEMEKKMRRRYPNARSWFNENYYSAFAPEVTVGREREYLRVQLLAEPSGANYEDFQWLGKTLQKIADDLTYYNNPNDHLIVQKRKDGYSVCASVNRLPQTNRRINQL